MDLNARQAEAVAASEPALLIAAGPGTGKTRVFAARAARLIMEGLAPERLLAVTFTRAAAMEMRERLAALVGAEAVERAWIDTFHAAARRILKEEGRAVELLREEEAHAFLEGLVPPRERKHFLEDLRRRKQALEPSREPAALQYWERLRAAGRVDFDDLFLDAVELLKEPAARSRWQGRFAHALVDEFQDTSLAQYEFLTLLKAANVCAVGDPDQSIYGFACGTFSAFERFAQDHPGHRRVALDENYRSQSVILEAARQVIARNPSPVPRELAARLEKGLPLEIAAHATPAQEAEMIGRRIEALLGGASPFTVDTGWARKEEESGRYGLGDVAVLYRFNAQAEAIEKALARLGLPAVVYGRKPDRGAELDEFRDDPSAAPPAELPRHDKISLMTLHRAKGLEFPVVFVAGCDEGLLPAADADAAEERRLFYVGLTRARRRLFLSHVGPRRLFGHALPGKPSPFLSDIAETLRVIAAREAPKPRRAEQQSLFEL